MKFINEPFLARLIECAHGGIQYLVFDGKLFSVVIFANDDNAQEYADARGELPFYPWPVVATILDRLHAAEAQRG